MCFDVICTYVNKKSCCFFRRLLAISRIHHSPLQIDVENIGSLSWKAYVHVARKSESTQILSDGGPRIVGPFQ